MLPGKAVPEPKRYTLPPSWSALINSGIPPSFVAAFCIAILKL